MKTKYWLALVTAALLWSTSFPVIKVGLQSSTPVELVFLRFFFAGLLGLALLIKSRAGGAIKVLWHPTVMLLGFINALGFYLQFEGQAHTLAAKAALLVNMYVVFVGIVAYFVLGERPHGYHFGSLALALMGAGFTTIGPYGLQALFGTSTGRGDLLVLGAAFVWAFYIVYSRKIAGTLPSTWIMAGVMWWTFMPLSVLYLGVDHQFHFPAQAVGIGLYLAIFCSVLPYSLYVFALEEVTALSSSIVLLLEIVLAVVWSFLFLGERFQPVEVLGGTFVILAIALLMIFEAKNNTSSSTVE